ncbi:MAG: UDP-2,3-diacylglucosamine diphosphatase [Opitutales bacterium]
MKKRKIPFKSVILSDVHLGTRDCRIHEVNHFLESIQCERLILNGDIIDGWSLSRRGGWTKHHTHFIRRILKLAEKKNTEVIYLAGNHDDMLRNFIPIFFDKFRIQEQYILDNQQGRYLCLHGDVFDAITTHSKFLALLGDIGYQNLLRLNRVYAKYRQLRGKAYFSLSKAIKAKVKSAVSHLSQFENHLKQVAQKNDCTGVICGHIHTPENKMIAGVHYLNSGDWVESLTAIVEDFSGTFKVVEYADFCREHNLFNVSSASNDSSVNQAVEA